MGGRGESVARLSSLRLSDGSGSSSSESASIQLCSRARSHGGECLGDGTQLDDVKEVAAVMIDCSRKLIDGAAGPRETSVPDTDPGSVDVSS